MMRIVTASLHSLAALTLLAPVLLLAQPTSVSPDEARFREIYQRQYNAVKGVASDMVVMELRDRIELVASRGSQVGAASNDRRVRGFESALLQGLQAAHCQGGTATAARPSPAVIEKVNSAATAQRLRTESADVAEVSALAQRLLDSQPRERWCALKSLDDIR